MSKKALPLLSLALLAGCTVATPSSSEGAASSPPASSAEPSAPASSYSSEAQNPESESSSSQEEYLFTPKVGEVRKWFDHGTFGESKFYNYCPSVFVEDNVKHVYYCTNKLEGNVTDYVGYREGALRGDSFEFTSTENLSYLLSPTKDTWDSRHTCDPSVVKGKFKMGGETYSYLMAYLGCVTSDNSLNEVGIAVSKSPSGPFVKVDAANPLVPYDPDQAAWGTGQPSVVSIDGEGKVALFYSVGNKTGTYTEVREYDLSDLGSPKLVRTKKVSTYGLSDTVLCNADFAYDETNKRILMVKGRQPFGKDGKTPNFIADTLDVYAMDDSASTNRYDEVFKGNNANDWVKIGTIDESLTGFARNHNAGFVTDPYGCLIEKDRVEVAFTRSDYGESTDWSYLTTYRIYSTSIGLTYVK